MRIHGFGEIFIEVIDTLSLNGAAFVEVNNRVGQSFLVKSADNFNVAIEPLNLLIKKHLENFAYVFSNGHKTGPTPNLCQ